MNTPRGVYTWQERLAAKASEPDENGCHLWTGAMTPAGYGSFTGPFGIERNMSAPAHRWAYIAAFGSIPPRMHIDHLCNVRACVNPSHLEPVTPSENMRRSWARRRAVA